MIYPNSSDYVLGIIFLSFFGLFYSFLVQWLVRNGYLEGDLWAAVSLGVAVVLVVVGFLFGWLIALLIFGLFASCGAWMFLGEKFVYARGRKKEEKHI